MDKYVYVVLYVNEDGYREVRGIYDEEFFNQNFKKFCSFATFLNKLTWDWGFCVYKIRLNCYNCNPEEISAEDMIK